MLEIFVVIDRSKDMGPSMEAMRGAMARLLDAIRDGDRFNLFMFGPGLSELARKPLVANPKSRELASWVVDNLDPQGDTRDFETAVTLALHPQREPNVPRVALVVSDFATKLDRSWGEQWRGDAVLVEVDPNDDATLRGAELTLTRLRSPVRRAFSRLRSAITSPPTTLGWQRPEFIRTLCVLPSRSYMKDELAAQPAKIEEAREALRDALERDRYASPQITAWGKALLDGPVPPPPAYTNLADLTKASRPKELDKALQATTLGMAWAHAYHTALTEWIPKPFDARIAAPATRLMTARRYVAELEVLLKRVEASDFTLEELTKTPEGSFRRPWLRMGYPDVSKETVRAERLLDVGNTRVTVLKVARDIVATGIDTPALAEPDTDREAFWVQTMVHFARNCTRNDRYKAALVSVLETRLGRAMRTKTQAEATGDKTNAARHAFFAAELKSALSKYKTVDEEPSIARFVDDLDRMRIAVNED